MWYIVMCLFIFTIDYICVTKVWTVSGAFVSCFQGCLYFSTEFGFERNLTYRKAHLGPTYKAYIALRWSAGLLYAISYSHCEAISRRWREETSYKTLHSTPLECREPIRLSSILTAKQYHAAGVRRHRTVGIVSSILIASGIQIGCGSLLQRSNMSIVANSS